MAVLFYQSALGSVYLHSLGGSSYVHYYLLWGDTAAPSGLHARLCHAFLVRSVPYHNSKTTRPIFTKLLCILPVAVAAGLLPVALYRA